MIWWNRISAHGFQSHVETATKWRLSVSFNFEEHKVGSRLKSLTERFIRRNPLNRKEPSDGGTLDYKGATFSS